MLNYLVTRLPIYQVIYFFFFQRKTIQNITVTIFVTTIIVFITIILLSLL